MSGASTPRRHHANRLLAALGPEEIARLQPHLQPVALQRGLVLYEPGARVEHAYFPHDCVVSLLAILENGGSAEVAVFGCEGVVGYASSLLGREAFGRYIVQVAGTAFRLPLERLREATDVSPELDELLHRYTEALLTQTFQIVACNAVHTVEARCCRWILSTHDRVNRATLPLTHEFLAEMMGVQRSTVSLITRTLQSAGLINQRRGGITIIDLKGLQDISCECYGVIRKTFERLLPQTYPPRPRASADRL
ncbi:MAG TPA: Crp/Fnr family transcriptional regulator [Beijerinckiaceae bacterium]|jgi:CRP-like cAMP-binding protein